MKLLKSRLTYAYIDSSDIFNPAYVEGNVSQISGFASILGTVCQWVISIIGFGIVMASIAKNAINGLYAVNPKLFDQVDAIKRQGQGFGTKVKGGSNNMMKGLGWIIWIICSLIPNVKKMTDFDDEDGNTLDAAAYFSKAIPLTFVQIFIGVFIFFGYPSKVAKYVSDFGTGAFDVVLTNVDPLAWVESLPGKMAYINFATDNAPDSYGQATNKIANSMYKSVVGYYTDIEKSMRQEVAYNIEKIVIAKREAFYDKCNDDEYTLSVYSSVTSYSPDTSVINGTGTGAVSPDGVVTYAFYSEITEILESNVTTKEREGHYAYVQLTFTPKAAKGESRAITSVATIYTTGQSAGNAEQLSYITLSGPGGGVSTATGVEFYETNASGKMTVDGRDVRVNIRTTDGMTLQVTADTAGVDISKGTAINNITALSYYDGKNKHPIDRIIISNTSAPAKFVPKISTQYNEWTWGSSPARKVNTESSDTTGSTTGTTEPTTGSISTTK